MKERKGNEDNNKKPIHDSITILTFTWTWNESQQVRIKAVREMICLGNTGV